METAASYSAQPTKSAALPYPTIQQAWGLMAFVYLASIPAALPILVFVIAAESFALPFSESIGKTLVYVISLSRAIWYAMRQRGTRSLSFAPVPGSVYVVSTIGILVLGVLLEPLVSAVPLPTSWQQEMNKLFTKESIVSAVIAAPILEEALFRGIMLDGFLKRYPPGKAILWSGLLFGGFHILPNQALGAMIMGFALGWLYYRTRSLLLCMFLHFFNNSLASLALLFEDSIDMSRNITREWVGQDVLYTGLLLVCGGVCVACYQYLNQRLPAVQPHQTHPVGC